MKTFPSRLYVTILLCLALQASAVAEMPDINPVLQMIQNAVKEQHQIKEAQTQSDTQPITLDAPVDLKEPLKTFNLEQALKAAILRNPEFKATQARLNINSAEILTAGARINPALMTDNGIAEKTYRLGLEQTFELGGKRRRRIELAKAQKEALLADINTQLLNLRTTVRQAYTRLYNAQERQKAYQNILKVTQELVRIAQKREQVGDIPKLDTLQTEIVSINANNDLQLAGNEVVNAQSELNALLYQPLTVELSLATPSSTPQLDSVYPTEPTKPGGEKVLHGEIKHVELDLNRLIELALIYRPEIKQNFHNIQVVERQAALARANRIPNVTVATGLDAVTEPSQKATNAFITGRVDIPLLNRQQGPIQEALAREAQLMQEQAAIKNRIALEVSKAYTSYNANQERIRRYETQLLPYSVAIVDKSRLAFEGGKTNILAAINAQQAYMNTRLGYLQALMDCQNAISDLERAVGSGL